MPVSRPRASSSAENGTREFQSPTPMSPETGTSRDRGNHSTSVAAASDRRYSVYWLGPRFQTLRSLEYSERIG